LKLAGKAGLELKRLKPGDFVYTIFKYKGLRPTGGAGKEVSTDLYIMGIN